jgi:hypothetical protein
MAFTSRTKSDVREAYGAKEAREAELSRRESLKKAQVELEKHKGRGVWSS